MDAFEKKGLTPRYDNIVDLMRAYDRINTRIITNVELLDQIKKAEETWSEKNKTEDLNKLIVTSKNRSAYDKARKAGYKEFYDPFLRSYVAGTKKVKLELSQHLQQQQHLR